MTCSAVRRTLGVVIGTVLVGCSVVSCDSDSGSPTSAVVWPGPSSVLVTDRPGTLPRNVSDLAYEVGATPDDDVMWAVRNDPGSLFRLVRKGARWSTDRGWNDGLELTYPDGTGDPDAEGVSAGDPAASVYVVAERNNEDADSTRNSVLMYLIDDEAAGRGSVAATMEWDLTALLPRMDPNVGVEGITWVPDAVLVSAGFIDSSSSQRYAPDADDHGGGVFFVGQESGGTVHAFVLNATDGTARKVAEIATGTSSLSAVSFDAATSRLWVMCDNGCANRATVLALGDNGAWAPMTVYEPPAEMENLNNEGFALAPGTECTQGLRAVYWADDDDTDESTLRSGSLRC